MTPDARAALQRDIDTLRSVANVTRWEGPVSASILDGIADRLEALLGSVADPQEPEAPHQCAHHPDACCDWACEECGFEQVRELQAQLDAIEKIVGVPYGLDGLPVVERVVLMRKQRDLDDERCETWRAELIAVQQALAASHQETESRGHIGPCEVSGHYYACLYRDEENHVQCAWQLKAQVEQLQREAADLAITANRNAAHWQRAQADLAAVQGMLESVNGAAARVALDHRTEIAALRGHLADLHQRLSEACICEHTGENRCQSAGTGALQAPQETKP